VILVRSGVDEIWRVPNRAGFSDEDSLQALIEESLSLLSGSEHPSIVARELKVGGKQRIDLVAVDSTGAITLVECKLRDNPDFHRDVIGQAFGYAAHLWRMDLSEFEAAFEAASKSPTTSVVDQLDERMVKGLDAATFREAVASNLAAGRFRILIIVDEITEEMKQIVQFLNVRTQNDLAVSVMELLRINEGETDILLPIVFGEALPLHIKPNGSIVRPEDDLLVSVRSRANKLRNIKSKFFWRRFDVRRRSPDAVRRVEQALDAVGLVASAGTARLGEEHFDAQISIRLRDAPLGPSIPGEID
jgi:hypothetical protein